MTMSRIEGLNQGDLEAMRALTYPNDYRDDVSRKEVAYYQDENDDWHPSVLKRDDDIMVIPGDVENDQNGTPQAARVLGPGNGRQWFMAYTYQEPYGWGTGQYLLSNVRDRAPVDTEETPMPVIPPPPDPGP